MRILIKYITMFKRSIRPFHSSTIRFNLFGGGPNFGQSALKNPLDEHANKPPASNPADLFKRNDILAYSNKPINYIESVKHNGFHLANKLFISSPDKEGRIIGAVLLENESFEVDLTDAYKEINGFMIEFDKAILKVFEKINPKPEILVVGLGKKSRMLSPDNRKYLFGLGIQLEVGDSSHSAQIFDLLSTERPKTIGALLLPPNV